MKSHAAGLFHSILTTMTGTSKWPDSPRQLRDQRENPVTIRCERRQTRGPSLNLVLYLAR